jgi:hypothetical protein
MELARLPVSRDQRDDVGATLCFSGAERDCPGHFTESEMVPDACAIADRITYSNVIIWIFCYLARQGTCIGSGNGCLFVRIPLCQASSHRPDNC